MTHALLRQDRGSKLWGQCSCGEWCWLGTYHMPKGRLATLKAEFAVHLARLVVKETKTGMPPSLGSLEALELALPPQGVYGEWCRDPQACTPLGHCPKDPTCGD